MQNKENIPKDIIDRKPPVPIPVQDDGIFYQVEPSFIINNGSLKRIRLDTNYKYCTGVMFGSQGGFNSNGKVGLKLNGNYVFDRLPLSFVTGENVDNVNGSFFNTVFEAAGNQVEFTFDDVLNSVSFENVFLIFRLENKKPDFKNKNYDINFFRFNVGLNTGRFIFSYNKRIKKIAFYKISGSADIGLFTIRDSSRFYFKDMSFPFIAKLNLRDVNKRFIKCDAPTDNLMYEFNVVGTGSADIFVVFEYED